MAYALEEFTMEFCTFISWINVLKSGKEIKAVLVGPGKIES